LLFNFNFNCFFIFSGLIDGGDEVDFSLGIELNISTQSGFSI